MSFFGILAFSILSLSFNSTFTFSLLLPSTSIFLPPFLSPFSIPSLPTDPTIGLTAPLQSLSLCYLLKSPTTEHLSGDAFQCPGKGCTEQREQDLRGRRTGICKKLQAGKAWGTYTGTDRGESSPPAVVERILYSISAWNCQSKKKLYFIVRRRKINRKVFHLWSVGYLILSGMSVCVYMCAYVTCYFITECCYETSLPILHKSSFSDMWSLV